MEILTFVLVVAAMITAGVILRKFYRERILDPERARQWIDAQSLVQRRPDLALIEVVENYQPARRGTKSYVRWVRSGFLQDTWFWERTWSVGQLLVVAPSVGWGPHNRNPSTLYVRMADIVLQVPASSIRAAERVERRNRRRIHNGASRPPDSAGPHADHPS